jgi:7-cyano-7-deazaguanine synthase
MMQMLENDLIQAPALEVPLLRYTDRQLIELGEGLGVPWETAWSCAMNVEQPCASCPACRRRIAAFRAAGVIDTAFENQRRLQRSA